MCSPTLPSILLTAVFTQDVLFTRTLVSPTSGTAGDLMEGQREAGEEEKPRGMLSTVLVVGGVHVQHGLLYKWLNRSFSESKPRI